MNKIKEILDKKNLKLSVGESCTGGLMSSYLTDIEGSSSFVEINFVTYSEVAKMRFLGVKQKTIEKYTVVSKEVAKEMAEGLLKYAGVSISTTGYLGPTGGDEINPIGTVYFGFGYKNIIKVQKYISDKKTRCEIKIDIVKHVFNEFEKFLETNL